LAAIFYLNYYLKLKTKEMKSRHKKTAKIKKIRHPKKRLVQRHLESLGRESENYRTVLPKMKIIGVGGAGGNALSRIHGVIKGIETIALNTDVQDLRFTQADRKIQIGKNITFGRGAGMNPEMGAKSAEESKDEIAAVLQGAELAFITCGLGGGTGSGAAPVVAQLCRSLNMITIAVVTMPFTFEGKERLQIAQHAWNALVSQVDALITVHNDRIFSIIESDTSLKKAFWHVDEVLREGIQAISDLIIKPGLINVDFSDLKAIVQRAGPALLGIAIAHGEGRAEAAAERAINNPLVDGSIDNAHRVLLNVTACGDLSMIEVQRVAQVITERVHPSAKIIFGANFDSNLNKGVMKVTVVACDFEGSAQPSLIEEAPSGFGRKPLGAVSQVFPQEKIESSPLLKDALGEKIKPFENLEDQPAFLRKKKKD
jgi:cell division protein FtsZ